jgi:hypothetical protein
LGYDANDNMLTGLDGKTTTYVYGADGTRLKKIERRAPPAP